MKLIDPQIEDYALRHSQPEPKHLQNLAAKTHRQTDAARMMIGHLQGQFFKLVVEMIQPKWILEIGTFTGYSALSMAAGLPKGGKLITCEVDPKAQKIAQAAFDAHPLGKKIELRKGPALETIRKLTQNIDLAFIDADKDNYPVYYEEVLKRLRPGGFILLDNMLWSGRVLHPKEKSAKILAQLNRKIARDPRVENMLLPIRDGVQLVRKK